MAPIKEIFQNNPSYPDPSYISEWINADASSYITYTVYCDQNCDVQLDWAVDDSYQVIRTETIPLIAPTTVDVTYPTIARFIRFSVVNIAANPCNLKTSAFFLKNF